MKSNKEIEIKIRIDDKKEIQKRLLALGWEIDNLEFQRSFRLSRPDQSLMDKGIFPRTREEGQKSTFTIKVNVGGRVDEGDKERQYFEREEYEIEVEDAKKMADMLSLLGLSNQRILEKYRQTWRKDGKTKVRDLSITIDTLPFASFIEFEGPKEEIEEMLKKLELDSEERLTLAYWRVYRQYCRDNDLKEDSNLVFKKE